ncbi:shikimate dehydrogenase family protein [Luteirhabdus pelagi]|uniref:shikimate dehydrogenase family protein n=1 Tax=Luteirhabdus pelagi TaxID=2792783 RepID=UPI00193A365F|nr:shikimate dehydrogenase [Luteirhabdus pelagi]
MAKYGLVGRDIAYSFSKTFFTVKFEQENKPHSYHNFDIECIEKLTDVLSKNPDLKGFNVTIPFKESIISKLDRVDKEAQEIGAVNTVKILRDGRLAGYNTDHYGFAKALADFLPLANKKALILGTGGASKAILYVLKAMDIEATLVSRKKQEAFLSYQELTKSIMEAHSLIVNCTPLGTHPKVDEAPPIPYHYINKSHLLFDLVYNPKYTEFMKRGSVQGARTTNGLKMLEYQAKRAWKIWRQ